MFRHIAGHIRGSVLRQSAQLIRLAQLTPYFSAYFIKDCLYAMSCFIPLYMKNMPPLVELLSATSTLTDEALSFILFIQLSKMYCTPTIEKENKERFFLTIGVEFAIIF